MSLFVVVCVCGCVWLCVNVVVVCVDVSCVVCVGKGGEGGGWTICLLFEAFDLPQWLHGFFS